MQHTLSLSGAKHIHSALATAVMKNKLESNKGVYSSLLLTPLFLLSTCMSQAAPINVVSGDTKSIPGDYSDSQYDDVTIDAGGTLNATAMIDNRGTVTNNGVMNNSS